MRTLAVIPCLAIAMASVASADPADPPSVYDQVAVVRNLETSARDLVGRHFRALAAGDTKALDELWASTATATFRSGTTETVTPIGRALRKWVGKRKGMTWSLEDAGVLADGRVFVTASV